MAIIGPWGIRVDLSEGQVEEVKEFIKDIDGTQLDLGQASVKILKADVKERKDEYTLIFRYRYIKS